MGPGGVLWSRTRRIPSRREDFRVNFAISPSNIRFWDQRSAAIVECTHVGPWRLELRNFVSSALEGSDYGRSRHKCFPLMSTLSVGGARRARAWARIHAV